MEGFKFSQFCLQLQAALQRDLSESDGPEKDDVDLLLDELVSCHSRFWILHVIVVIRTQLLKIFRC